MKKTATYLVAGLIFTLICSFVLAPNPVAQDKQQEYEVGVDASFPPWTWVEKGEYKGFDVEVIRAIAEVEDLKIEITDMPWEGIIAALARGNIDMLVSGLSIKCSRDEKIDYSNPYWQVDQEILVQEDSSLNAITAMSMGHTVGAQRGTTGYMWMEDNLADKGVDISLKAYENYILAVKDLAVGRIDAVLADTETAQAFIDEGRPLKIVGSIATGEQYAYAVKEGDPHNLLPKINEGLNKIFESGKWVEIFNKYFPKKTPPTKIPLKRTKVCPEG